MLVALFVAAHVWVPAPAEKRAGPDSVVDEKCAAPAGITATKVRVMVLDMQATPRLAQSARSLGQIIAAEAARAPGYDILSADEVRAALDQEANKQLLGCDATSCLAELAQALDAALVVAGRLDETPDGAPIVSLTLLNTAAIVVVNRVSFTWPGDPQKLPDVARTAAQTLVLLPQQRPPGAIKIAGAPSDAQVLIDGADRSSDFRRGEIAGVPVGPHEVKVVATDKVAFTEHVVVTSAKTSQVDVVLEDVPIPSAWLWIGGTGAVVAGAGIALGVAYALGQSDVSVAAVVPALGPNDVETIKK